MLRFVVLYILWVTLLFFLFYFENASPLFFINQMQTQLTIQLTKIWIDIFDIPLLLQGKTLIFRHGMHLDILNDCNGLAGFLFFFAAVLAYPAQIQTKIYWSLWAYLVILTANTIRIDSILYHVTTHPENFYFVHEVLGRYIFAVIPLILFYLFIQ